jgi:hypothetical protein
MYLGTIEKRLEEDKYESMEDAAADIRLGDSFRIILVILLNLLM